MFEKEISSKTKVPTFQKSILKTFFYVSDTLCVAQKTPSKITDSEDSGQVNSRARLDESIELKESPAKLLNKVSN